MPGIPHLSGIQSFNSDLFRTGTAEAGAQQGNAAASDKAQANAVQAAPETARGQRGADPDGDDADIRRERARLDAENRPRFEKAEKAGDVVRIGGDRRESTRSTQADLFANPFVRRPQAKVAAAETPVERPGVRPEFVKAEEEPAPSQLDDVTA